MSEFLKETQERMLDLIYGIKNAETEADVVFLRAYNDALAGRTLVQSYLGVENFEELSPEAQAMFMLGYSTAQQVAKEANRLAKKEKANV